MKHLQVALTAAMLFPWGGSAGSNAAMGAGFPEGSIPQIQCQPVAQIDARIRYCSQNFEAVNAAEDCSRQVTQAWEKAAPDLALVSKHISLSQEAQLGQSEAKLQSATKRLERLIAQTSQATDLIALYPTVMVDSPGITDVSESLPCYSNAFTQIQLKVNKLDAKADEGRAALAQTKQLQAGVRAAAKSIRSTAGLAPAPVLSGKGESAPKIKVTGAKKQNSVSDITGTKERPELN